MPALGTGRHDLASHLAARLTSHLLSQFKGQRSVDWSCMNSSIRSVTWPEATHSESVHEFSDRYGSEG